MADVSAEDLALQDLRGVYRAGRQREMDTLDSSDREALVRQAEERAEDIGQLRLRLTSLGTPRSIVAPGFRISSSELRVPPRSEPRVMADAFVERFAAVWRVTPADFAEAEITIEPSQDRTNAGITVVTYRQRWRGIAVVSSRVRVLVDTTRDLILGATGSFLPITSLETVPSIPQEDARRLVAELTDGTERAGPAGLAIWSGYRSGGNGAPHLAWRASVLSEDGGIEQVVFVDATEGTILGRETVSMSSLRRSIWDHRDISTLNDGTCNRWNTRRNWPDIDSCDCSPVCTCPACPSTCDACRLDMASCPTCACHSPDWGESAVCEASIWRYDESTGCVGNGSPVGEPGCGTASADLWSDAANIHGYWATSFGRDSWDGAGGYIWGRARANVGAAAGRARPFDIDSDFVIDFTQAAFATPSSTNPWLSGHEWGHTLQMGTHLSSWLGPVGFHATSAAAMEHNADIQGWHYQGLPVPSSCGFGTLHHYTQLVTDFDDAQVNKLIGNCQAWLATQQLLLTLTWFGVEVQPISPTDYDLIWYRALSMYFSRDDSYFDWWNAMSTAAFDLFGVSSQYDAAQDSAEAIGTWNNPGSVATIVNLDERYSAVSWQGAPRGPCVSYRSDARGAGNIFFRCFESGGLVGSEILVNDVAVDPAASEPTATFRYEPGGTYAYVLWQGTTNRIQYRRIDLSTMSVGPAQDMGASHLTGGPIAAAPIFESGTLDRLVVIYHPLAHPDWFYWTSIGSTTACDMGASYDSDVAPSLTSFPYYDRIYFVRANPNSGAAPRDIQYGSYTLSSGCSGWSTPASLSALYAADPDILSNVMRTDEGVALAEYNRDPGTHRLRMTYVTLPGDTGGTSELWYATLEESSPGVLSRGNYRAVPLESTAGVHRSTHAGGLAAHPSGYPLFHFWAFYDKLWEWRTFSD